MKKTLRKIKANWMLGEDIPDMDFFFSQIWLTCFVNEFAKPAGRAYKKILAVYKGYHLWFYYDQEDSKKVGDVIVKKFINQPGFIKKANQEIVRHSDTLRHYFEKIEPATIKKMTNMQLWQIYSDHDRLHTDYYCWDWLPVAADMFHNNFT